jgi:hypothetical protein
MKVVTLIFALLLSSVAFGQRAAPSPQPGDTPPNMAIEAKHPDFVKNWYVGLGPVVSTNFLGSNGTKYDITVGYAQGVSEHWNLLFFSDNNFNTASQGSTDVMTVNVGGQWFLRDRGADNSLFLQGDLGYGGGNRFNDSNMTGALAAGFQFFRTAEFTFEAIVRVELLYTNQGSTISGPNLTQVRFGVYF